MTEKKVTIINRAGIHARPAAMLVQTANQFASEIYIEKDSERINGKSIMGIITLGATFDSELNIVAEGDDEAEAVDAIAKLFVTKFQEE